MAFAVIIVAALVLAPGLQSAVVQTGDLPSIANYPQTIEDIDDVQILPEYIEGPALRPLPLPVPTPEVALPELRPEPLENPCDACFSYMTTLIEQLATIPEIQPHPMPTPENEVLPHPLPEAEVLPEPHPLPVPEIEIQPHPVPEVEIRPLPEFIPVIPETRPLPVQPEIRPLPSIIDQ